MHAITVFLISLCTCNCSVLGASHGSSTDSTASASWFPDFVLKVFNDHAQRSPYLSKYVPQYAQEYDQYIRHAATLPEHQLDSMEECSKKEALLRKWNILEGLLKMSHVMSQFLGFALQCDIQQVVFERNSGTKFVKYKGDHKASAVDMLGMLCGQYIPSQCSTAIDIYAQLKTSPNYFFVNYVEKRWEMCFEAIRAMTILYEKDHDSVSQLLQIQRDALQAADLYTNSVLCGHSQRYRPSKARDFSFMWELKGAVQMTDAHFMERSRKVSTIPATTSSLPISILLDGSCHLRDNIVDMNEFRMKLRQCDSPTDIFSIDSSDSKVKNALKLGHFDTSTCNINSSLLSYYLLSSTATAAEIDNVTHNLFTVDDASCYLFAPQQKTAFMTNAIDSTSLVFMNQASFKVLPRFLESIIRANHVSICESKRIQLLHALAIIEQALKTWIFQLYNCTHNIS